MITCPKCGTLNPDGSANCKTCRVNLQFALQHPDEVSRPGIDEQRIAKLAKTQNDIQRILVTTTAIVQNLEISEYLGVVFSSVAIGSGFLSGVGAEIADTFGTRAGGLQQKLALANEAALQDLKEQAVQRGADAIIGFNADYSVLGNTMLVSVRGTLVKFTPPP